MKKIIDRYNSNSHRTQNSKTPYQILNDTSIISRHIKIVTCDAGPIIIISSIEDKVGILAQKEKIDQQNLVKNSIN